MFEFSCQNSNLVNWVLDQITYRPDAIFPKNKGWELYIRIYYPTSFESCFFVVVVSDREDGILFVPFDESSPVEALPQFLQTRFTDLISRDLEFSCQSFQTIFLTSEKHQSQIIRKLDTIQLVYYN